LDGRPSGLATGHAKYPALFDQVLADTGIEIVLKGIRVPRMNSIIERWVQTCRRELPDRR